MKSSGRILAALLLNPTGRATNRTVSRLDYTLATVRCDRVEVANLVNVPSADMRGLALDGTSQRAWELSRLTIEALLNRADEILVAWGVSVPAGPALIHHRNQVNWVVSLLQEREARVWTMGGTPRHPSRWHQHLRVRANDPQTPFEMRISEGLVQLEAHQLATLQLGPRQTTER